MVHIYSEILLNHKRNKIVPFAETWMDLKFIFKELFHLYCFEVRVGWARVGSGKIKHAMEGGLHE